MRYLLILISLFLLNCKKKVVVDPTPVVLKDPPSCKVLSDFRTDGQLYEYDFSNDRLTGMKGFNDFNSFVYDANNVITKAYHTNNKTAEILFSWSGKLLKKVNFTGTDSRGKTFNYETNINHNSDGKITTLLLDWPTFKEKVNAKFIYDLNGNVIKMDWYNEGEWKTIIENQSFDDKRSAYKNQELGQILSYYMVYTAIGGGFNFSNLINTNNVLKSTVYQGDSRITYTYDYTYNANKYPLDVEYTKVANNKSEVFKQKFTYQCAK